MPRIRTAQNRRSILKPSECSMPISGPATAKVRLGAGAAGLQRRADIRQPAARQKLTIFHVVKRPAAGRSERSSKIAGEPAIRRHARVAGPGDQSVAVLIPLATRIVVAKDCRICFGFIEESERQVTLDKPLQRLGYMCRRLIIVDDALEAVHRSQVLAPFQVVSTDFHFLTGQMIKSEVKFQLGVSGIFAVGKSADDIIEGLEGLLGDLLVTANISDLNVGRDGFSIISIGDVTM